MLLPGIGGEVVVSGVPRAASPVVFAAELPLVLEASGVIVVAVDGLVGVAARGGARGGLRYGPGIEGGKPTWVDEGGGDMRLAWDPACDSSCDPATDPPAVLAADESPIGFLTLTLELP